MKKLWEILNGKKLNTGVVLVVTAIIIEKTFGTSSEVASKIATDVMLGIGGVTTIVGYIHRLIKTKKT